MSAPTGATEDNPSYYANMLDLPDGTVLHSNFASQLFIYQPAGTPLAAGKPAITSITQNADASFHVVGTRLNGISEGAAYGDDGQMNSNYPLIRMTDSGGNIYYARSYNWSSTSVMTGTSSVSTEFTLPPGLPTGMYSVVAVANGISSDSVPLTVAPIAIGLPTTIPEQNATVTGTLTLPSISASDTVISLASSITSQVSVPTTATITAGQSSVTFPLTIMDDGLLTGTAAGYNFGILRRLPGRFVHDDRYGIRQRGVEGRACWRFPFNGNLWRPICADERFILPFQYGQRDPFLVCQQNSVLAYAHTFVWNPGRRRKHCRFLLLQLRGEYLGNGGADRHNFIYEHYNQRNREHDAPGQPHGVRFGGSDGHRLQYRRLRDFWGPLLASNHFIYCF